MLLLIRGETIIPIAVAFASIAVIIFLSFAH